MEKRKVRKGLESPLYIRGLPKRYFWRFVPFVGIGFSTVLIVIVDTCTQEVKPWGNIGIAFALVIPLLIGLYTLFFYLGEKEKKPHRFGNQASTISNRDLLDYVHS